MGRDQRAVRQISATARISIHSPRMGRDAARSAAALSESRFQSTLPAWGETRSPAFDKIFWRFQSTLPAWGETGMSLARIADELFQSTLPAWGETGSAAIKIPASGISIHSPRMGRDDLWQGRLCPAHDFNPLSPHGERPTAHPLTHCCPTDFNPLSPHGERRKDSGGQKDCGNFNPLSPHGERPA